MACDPPTVNAVPPDRERTAEAPAPGVSPVLGPNASVVGVIGLVEADRRSCQNTGEKTSRATGKKTQKQFFPIPLPLNFAYEF
jgi:hypothetical protein